MSRVRSWALVLLLCAVLPCVVRSQETLPRVTSVAASPASPSEGRSVTLTASVANPSGSILRYRWDFGDGESAESGDGLSALTHTYRDDGRFTVTVTVTDPDGVTARGATEVEVANEAPAVEVLTGPDEAATGEPASLEGLARDPGVDDVLTYRWDFGDGESAAGEDLRRTTHAFAAPGVYTVELSVSDDGDLSDTRVVTVSVDRTFRFEMSGAVGGTIEGGFDDRPGFLAHGSGDSREIPDGYCQVTITAGTGTGTGVGGGGQMVILAGQLPAPIVPDVYPLARRLGPGVVAVQDLQCGNPGVDCSGGLWRGSAVSGSLRLTEVTPERIAGEVSAGMERGDAAYQLTGSFVSVPSRMAGIALGLNPGCFRTERFAVDTHHPELDQANVDPEDPRIEVTFTDDVDRASVSDATFVVEVRRPAGSDPAYAEIDGAVGFSDGRTLRFTPARDLPDGVLPCVRVRGGRDGIRSVAGDTLEVEPSDGGEGLTDTRTSRACYGGGRAWPRAYEWGFATMVVPDDVRVELFQVARIGDGVTLVPDKPTAARVFAEWEEKDEYHPDVQVRRFPARVWVEGNGSSLLPARESVEIRRPDQFDARERRQGDNSVNFFGWKPGRGGPTTVRARLEPAGQEPDPPRVFDGAPIQAEHWDYSPSFTFDYYFLRIGQWTAEVPPESRSAGNILARRTADYTTQMFPVVATRARGMGDFEFELSDQAAAEGREVEGSLWDVAGVYMDLPGGFRGDQESRQIGENLYTFMRMFTDQVAPYTDANALVGYVPSTYAGGGGTDLQRMLDEYFDAGADTDPAGVPFRTIHINPRGDIYLTTALVHEFGHAFWLQHNPWVEDGDARTAECAGDRGVMPGIEGMRMAPDGESGWPKSSTDGNAESASRLYPLMYPCAQRVQESFVTNDSYVKLQEDIGAAIRGGFYRGAAVAAGPGGSPDGSPEPGGFGVPAGGPRAVWEGRGSRRVASGAQERSEALMVMGFVASGTARGEGSAAVGAVRPVPVATPASSRSSGPYRLVLQGNGGVVLQATGFGLLRRLDPDREGGSGYFSVVVPAVEGVREVMIERGDTVLGRRSVSASPPTVRILEPEAGASVDGPTAVAWEAQDDDGDAVRVTVLYSATGQRPWRALGVHRRTSRITLDGAALAAGPRPTLRLVASDGYHESEARVRVRVPESTAAEASAPKEAEPARDSQPSSAAAEAGPPGSAPGPGASETVVLGLGETYTLADGHTITAYGVTRGVEGKLEMMGAAETVRAAVMDVEVCAGSTALSFALTQGAMFGLRLAGAGETHHGWSGQGIAWRGEATFGRSMMDGELPGGQCVRGPIPVAEPSRGTFDAVVFDTRTGGLGLPLDLQVRVAWVLRRG